MAEENAMAWVERVGISLGHRCHILLETNLFFWVSCGCHVRLPPHFQDKNQCWAAGEVSHVLTTLANEVAGPVLWIWRMNQRWSTAIVPQPEAENCQDLANAGPEAWAKCNPPDVDLLIQVILMCLWRSRNWRRKCIWHIGYSCYCYSLRLETVIRTIEMWGVQFENRVGRIRADKSVHSLLSLMFLTGLKANQSVWSQVWW